MHRLNECSACAATGEQAAAQCSACAVSYAWLRTRISLAVVQNVWNSKNLALVRVMTRRIAKIGQVQSRKKPVCNTARVLTPPIAQHTPHYASMGRHAWSKTRAPIEMSMDESLQVSGRVWHAFAVPQLHRCRNPRSKHWGPRRPRCRRVVAKTDRCRKN